jgi:hypothetical protein
MQLLAAQFSPIVNTEPEEHTTEVPKQELPGTMAIQRWGLQGTYPATSGFGRCFIEHCPSVPHDCNLRHYNVFERSLGGLLKLAPQDSDRSLGRFCLYAVHGGMPEDALRPLWKMNWRFAGWIVRQVGSEA